jgi:hypothetical protein
MNLIIEFLQSLQELTVAGVLDRVVPFIPLFITPIITLVTAIFSLPKSVLVRFSKMRRLRNIASLVWGQNLQKKLVKFVREEQADVDELLAEGKVKSAAWRACGTHYFLVWYFLKHPFSTVFNLIKSIFRGPPGA